MGPQISIYDSKNINQLNTWDIGDLQSQQASKILTVYVWNNKENHQFEGKSLVSDLRNAYVTVLDANGETAEDEVAKNRWVQVNVPSIDKDETTFFPIGGNITRSIKGGKEEGGEELTDNIISGKVSDVTSLSENNKVCKLNFIIVPPPNSTPGEKLFKIRIGGWYT